MCLAIIGLCTVFKQSFRYFVHMRSRRCFLGSRSDSGFPGSRGGRFSLNAAAIALPSYNNHASISRFGIKTTLAFALAGAIASVRLA